MRLSRMLIAISCAMLLNLLAVGVAQAYEWTVDESEYSGLKSKVSTSNSGNTFEISVPKLSLTIKCTSEKGTGELLGEATSVATITLSECIAVKYEKTCTVKSPEKSTGTLIATASTDFLVTLKGETEKSYDKVTLAMTVLLSGALCPLPEEMEMEGTTAAAVPGMQEEAVKRVRKFSKAIAEEAGVTSLSLGENQAFLTGDDTTTLTGTFQGGAQAVIGMNLNPTELTFSGTGKANAKPVVISSISNISLWVNKAYSSNPAFVPTTNCDTLTLWVDPRNPCTVTVTCNEKPKLGSLVVEWRVSGSPTTRFSVTSMNCP